MCGRDGRFLEAMASAQVDIEVSELDHWRSDSVILGNMCTVFAE
jgi:activator of 2-hydroxyglutaryl-CoA dehydratase